MTVRLGGQLPAGDKNGLVRITSQLIDDPHAAHIAVVVLDCKQLTVNTDDETQVPLVRIRAIEPLLTEGDIASASLALRKAFEQRTGKVELPFDMVQDAERVTITEREELPQASELGGTSEIDGDHETALEEAAERGLQVQAEDDPDNPPWSEGYPEGQTDEAPAEADDNVRAFRSPFASQTSGS